MAKERCCSMGEPTTKHKDAVTRVPASASAIKRRASLNQQQAHLDNVDDLLKVAWARDLLLLAALNDREPTAELLESLRSTTADNWFGFKAQSEITIGACSLLDAALEAMPNPIDTATLDQLAADYAAIYLLHTYRAPPTESPWLDKDQLERQEPMFELAAWYGRFGLAAQDRQRRSDDHMVLQLQFLAHLLSAPDLDVATSFAEVSRFMDQHLIRWIGDFADRIATRCETPYYCGVVTLTDGYLNSLRDALADRYGLARPVVAEAESAPITIDDDDDDVARYIPGVAPSW